MAFNKDIFPWFRNPHNQSSLSILLYLSFSQLNIYKTYIKNDNKKKELQKLSAGKGSYSIIHDIRWEQQKLEFYLVYCRVQRKLPGLLDQIKKIKKYICGAGRFCAGRLKTENFILRGGLESSRVCAGVPRNRTAPHRLPSLNSRFHPFCSLLAVGLLLFVKTWGINLFINSLELFQLTKS